MDYDEFYERMYENFIESFDREPTQEELERYVQDNSRD